MKLVARERRERKESRREEGRTEKTRPVWLESREQGKSYIRGHRRGQPGPWGHCKEFMFYSQWSGQTLKGSKKGDDMNWFMFLKVTLPAKYRMICREAVREARISVLVMVTLLHSEMFLNSIFVLHEVFCFLVFHSFC